MYLYAVSFINKGNTHFDVKNLAQTRSFFNLMPIKGYEFSSKIEYKMSRYNNIKIKFYSKNKEKNYQLGNYYGLFTNSLKYYKRSYIRSEYYFKNNAFRYKFCLEYSLYSETSSQMEYEKHNFKKCGTIMENYLVLTPVKDLEFSFWHIYYLSGIDIIMFYKFEHDLPGQFYINSFSGRGDKKYLMIKYDFNQYLRLVFKISERREFGTEDCNIPEKI